MARPGVLLSPAYTVAIPQPKVRNLPVASLLPRGDGEMVGFINTWLELKKRDRPIDALYDYWLLGENAVPQQPGWLVLGERAALGAVMTQQEASHLCRWA